jgi:hypothetical protein
VIRDIDRQHEGAAAGALDLPLSAEKPVTPARDQPNISSLGSEGLHRCPPHAGRSPGNDHNFLLFVGHGNCPLEN